MPSMIMGAAATLATLRPSTPDGGALPGGGTVAEEAGAALVLIGGAESGSRARGRGPLPTWVYRLGLACSGGGPSGDDDGTRTGCARGQQCDGTRGVCLCADGGPPPCTRAPPPPAGIVLRDGALSMIAQAWVLVGVSVLGAHAGGRSVRWGLQVAERRRAKAS